MSDPLDGWCDIVGDGRMGRALARALRDAGMRVRGPLGRGAEARGAAVVLLCVPDREIASASRALAPGSLVGHVSASTPLDVLTPHERFLLHPLLSVTDASAAFAGAACMVDGDSPRARAVGSALARRLAMRTLSIPPDRRALYHAAASAASNFLVTVLGLAEELGGEAGVDREALLPLVRSAVQSWGALGAPGALTGPVARGDEVTLTRQRAAVASVLPALLPDWDALVQATRRLAERRLRPNGVR